MEGETLLPSKLPYSYSSCKSGDPDHFPLPQMPMQDRYTVINCGIPSLCTSQTKSTWNRHFRQQEYGTQWTAKVQLFFPSHFFPTKGRSGIVCIIVWQVRMWQQQGSRNSAPVEPLATGPFRKGYPRSGFPDGATGTFNLALSFS